MINLLITIVAILAVLAIVQIVRIVELSAQISGEKDETETIKKDGNMNAIFMMVFLVGELFFMIYQTFRYKKFILPEPASLQGVITDRMLYIIFALIIFVFFVTQILLFFYTYKYKFNKGRRSFFFPDSHKLEFIWTAIPTVVLFGIIIYGLNVWNEITAPAPADAKVIEVYAKQFDWTVRYSGKDNTLGKAGFRLVSDENILGVDKNDKNSADDIITKELHMPVNTPILLKFRAQDVIHSVYLPHFRVQMNTVPGMPTHFFFNPTITTREMRIKTNNPKFDYILLCNKVCGVAHYMMKMKVVVESNADYNIYLKSQKTLSADAPTISSSSATKVLATK